MFRHVKGYDVEFTIVRARDLIAKDRHLLTRQRTTSDPYVEVFLGLDQRIGQTTVVEKNLNPEWNATFTFHLSTESSSMQYKTAEGEEAAGIVFLKLYDEDVLTDADLMGTLVVPIPATTEQKSVTKWYPVETLFCPNAKGDVEIHMELKPILGGPLSRLSPEGGVMGAIAPSPQKVAKWAKAGRNFFTGNKVSDDRDDHDDDNKNAIQENDSPTRRQYVVALVQALYDQHGLSSPSSKNNSSSSRSADDELYEMSLENRLDQDTDQLEDWLEKANDKSKGKSSGFASLLRRH